MKKRGREWARVPTQVRHYVGLTNHREITASFLILRARRVRAAVYSQYIQREKIVFTAIYYVL